MNTIQVTFDKSHLITIGEKLYGESLELLRELISNAYDADATEVHIDITTESFSVRDNGSGMNEQGLKEFFTIGSQNKRRSSISPRFQRERIGQFGIGKFAVLTACSCFRVRTQQDGYSAEVVFDKKEWNNDAAWHVPYTRSAYNEKQGNGTTVILEKLQKKFSLPDVERFIRERMPLNAPHFTIFLNDRRLEPTLLIGRKFGIKINTSYGFIKGELTLPHSRKHKEEPGIECVVRGVVICRTTFGVDHPIAERLRGRIEANFVPITSDRSRFITDSQEYRTLAAAMIKELRSIIRMTKDIAEQREQQKADMALKDTLIKMRRAIRRNPDIAPPILSATEEIDAKEDNGNIAQQIQVDFNNRASSVGQEDSQSTEPPPKKVRIKNIQGKTVVARTITIGGRGITCSQERCGRDRPAAFTEGGIVYINIDHPHYKKQQAKGQEFLSFYMTYLLSQQVALMISEGDTRKAFDIQDRLLTDSW